jgi:hypothetical protein
MPRTWLYSVRNLDSNSFAQFVHFCGCHWYSMLPSYQKMQFQVTSSPLPFDVNSRPTYVVSPAIRRKRSPGLRRHGGESTHQSTHPLIHSSTHPLSSPCRAEASAKADAPRPLTSGASGRSPIRVIRGKNPVIPTKEHKRTQRNKKKHSFLKLKQVRRRQ